MSVSLRGELSYLLNNLCDKLWSEPLESSVTYGLYAALAAFFLFGLYAVNGVLNHFLYRHERSAIEKLRAVVEEHKATLAKKRYQLIRIDDYGVIDLKGWHKEIGYFFEKLVLPALTTRECEAIRPIFSEILQEEIEDVVRPISESLKIELQFDQTMTPIDFEHYVASLFAKAGWKADVSKASGDQGADVIADRHGHRIVVQCKLYGSPVGNKAVQEIVAAKHHYQADLSFVVTNASFTPSARQLAKSTNVSLLHYSEVEAELNRLEQLII